MLTDEANKGLRKKAADTIKALNAEGPPSSLVQEFHKPEVNWKVKSYDKLIGSLAFEDMSPPPVTLDLTPEEIDAIAIIFENTVDPLISPIKCLMLGRGKPSINVLSLSSLKSPHTRSVPSGFSARCRADLQVLISCGSTGSIGD